MNGRDGSVGSAAGWPRGRGAAPPGDPHRSAAPPRPSGLGATEPERHDTADDAARGADGADGAGTGPVEATGPTVEDLEDRLRRALADLDNLRKRVARELSAERAAERARVAALWLPVLDNLERALDHAGSDHDPVVEGVRAVRDHAVAVLATLGFHRHEEVGVPFDPRRHEAVVTRPEPGVQPGTVVEVLRPGYGDGSRQLRPAAVVVATAPA
jgi:molecular chaperone GrpE